MGKGFEKVRHKEGVSMWLDSTRRTRNQVNKSPSHQYEQIRGVPPHTPPDPVHKSPNRQTHLIPPASAATATASPAGSGRSGMDARTVLLRKNYYY